LSKHLGQRLPRALPGNGAPHWVQTRSVAMIGEMELAFTHYYSRTFEPLHAFCEGYDQLNGVAGFRELQERKSSC
jgi:hypothetical protein